MGIINITEIITGQVGVVPADIYIETNDTLATVLTPGYLNTAKQNGFNFANNQIAQVYGSNFQHGNPGCLLFQVSAPPNPGTGNYSLISMASAGEVVLPVTANHIATYVGTSGAIGDDAATAINGGNIQAGVSGTAGALISYPALASSGYLELQAANNAGNTATIIKNASMAQATTLTIPDPGASTANFLLSSGSSQTITGNLAVTGTLASGSTGAGGSLTLYPVGGSTDGSLIVAAANNGGGYSMIIENAANIGQGTTITIPDPGTFAANMILSASPSGQTIAGGLTLSNDSLNVSLGSVICSQGSFTAGSSGHSGFVKCYPPVAVSGYLELAASGNAGNTPITITNASFGQTSIITIPDPGQTNANFLLSASGSAQSMAGGLTLSSGSMTVSSGNVLVTSGSISTSAGHIVAGSSGNAGSFYCYPVTASTGYFELQAVSNAGNTAVVLKNASMGQASSFTIPDPGQAAAQIAVAPNALVNGNLVEASGTAGLIADAGIAATNVQNKTNIRAFQSANIGGAGAGPIEVSISGLTSASVVIATIESTSNACYVRSATPGSGQVAITFSADPGATAIVNIVAFIAAQ